MHILHILSSPADTQGPLPPAATIAAQQGHQVDFLAWGAADSQEAWGGFPLWVVHASLEPAFEKSVGEAPLQSQRVFLAVMRWIDEHGAPDIIQVPAQNALGYFLLQNKWTLAPALRHSRILLCLPGDAENAALNGNALPGQAPVHSAPTEDFQLPGYWTRQLEAACRLMADGVLRQTDTQAEWVACYQAAPAGSDAPRLFPFLSPCELQPVPAPPTPGVPGLLSVVIPFYNLGDTLREAVESVYQGTYPHREVIVVNDGSTEEASLRVLKALKQEYPSLCVLDIANSGVENARNVGARHAKGEYIAFLDADDMVNPAYHSRCIDVLCQYKNVGFVYAWARRFEDADSYWVTYNTQLPYMLLCNMAASSSVVRRDLYLAFGQNRPAMRQSHEDHDGWLGIMEQGYFGVCIPQPLFLYRVRAGSSFRTASREKELQAFRLLAENHPALYQKYAQETTQLLIANGSPLHWANPSVPHSPLGYRSEEDLAALENAQRQLAEIHQSPSLFWRAVRWVWQKRAGAE